MGIEWFFIMLFVPLLFIFLGIPLTIAIIDFFRRTHTDDK